ncbi:uncharacterized protein CDAR_197241 [Caerostris darwini]|uniref:N-acetyltransferase domain-containing protein n=1 Tax=Caerostris darwini TaxID=1538125 RepID=A0AAV4M6L6_9ARAC|nr:uncharacterized protein CDAR_197241 [Caerostris darwini]
MHLMQPQAPYLIYYQLIFAIRKLVIIKMPVRSLKLGLLIQNKCFARSLREADLPQLMAVRRELKVHDVESTIKTFWEMDSNGVKVVESEKGEIMGACAFIRNQDLYFGGLYCVRPKFQGLGIGIEVWNACMDHVGPHNAALNAVPGKMELYRDKAGFPIVEDEFFCQKYISTQPVNPHKLTNIIPKDVIIEPVENQHFPTLYEYDYSIMGYERRLAICLNCREKNSNTYVATQNGRIIGYGTIKTSCMGTARIGPLYADDPLVAEALVKQLIISLPNVNGFVMNTLSNNPFAENILQKLGVPLVENLTRMYRKNKMVVNTSKIYAVFDLNLAPF